MPKEKPEKKGIPIFAPFKSREEGSKEFHRMIDTMPKLPKAYRAELIVWFCRFATTINEGD